jgi:hypothetical protein
VTQNISEEDTWIEIFIADTRVCFQHEAQRSEVKSFYSVPAMVKRLFVVIKYLLTALHEIIKAVLFTAQVFWDVTSYRLVNRYRKFRSTVIPSSL